MIDDTTATVRAAGLLLALLLAGCRASDGEGQGAELRVLTIDSTYWSNEPGLPPRLAVAASHLDSLYLLAHVVEWDGPEPFQRFTARADKDFRLVSDGERDIRLRAGKGGITSSDGSLRYVMLRPLVDLRAFEPGEAYRLRPANGVSGYTWVVEAGVEVIAPPGASAND